MVAPELFIDRLKKYVGVPYRYGGKTSGGLDCSGLIWLAMNDLGKVIPHGSGAQINACTPISVDEAWATPGAMLWRDGHNAISLGDGTAIEAITPKVSITKRTETFQGKPRFTRGGLLPHIKYTEAPLMVRMSSPVQGRVSSPYGMRTLGNSRSLHAGIDIAAPKDSVVRAAYGGTVEKVVAGRKPGQSANAGAVLAPGRSGNGVVVRNPDGERQLYGHITPSVKVGDVVRMGDILGRIDLSGITTGAHLHLETWNNSSHSSHRDPMIDFKHHGVTPGGEPVKPKPAAKPKPGKEWPDVPLVVDGDFGTLTRTAYQRFLAKPGHYKGKIDSIFGNLSVRGEQYWLRSLGYYKGWIDGVRKKLTIKALQNRLRNKRLYGGRIDGIDGPLTVKGLQQLLNEEAKNHRK